MLRSLLAAIAVALVLAAPASAAEPTGYDDDAYWAFADRMQQRVDERWDEDAGYYRLAGGQRRADGELDDPAHAFRRRDAVATKARRATITAHACSRSGSCPRRRS